MGAGKGLGVAVIAQLVSGNLIGIEVFDGGVAVASFEVFCVNPQPQLPKSENVLYGVHRRSMPGEWERGRYVCLSIYPFKEVKYAFSDAEPIHY